MFPGIKRLKSPELKNTSIVPTAEGPSHMGLGSVCWELLSAGQVTFAGGGVHAPPITAPTSSRARRINNENLPTCKLKRNQDPVEGSADTGVTHRFVVEK